MPLGNRGCVYKGFFEIRLVFVEVSGPGAEAFADEGLVAEGGRMMAIAWNEMDPPVTAGVIAVFDMTAKARPALP